MRHGIEGEANLRRPEHTRFHHVRLAVDVELDQEASVSTLRRAFAAGLPFDVELHARAGLRPLAPRPEFRALLRPRD